MSAQNRRRHPRVALRAEVDMRSDDNFFAGRTRDISLGGLFVEADVGLSIGARVMVHLSLEGEELSIPSEVVWTLDGEVPGRTGGVGVRFLSLSSAERKSIGAFMRKRTPLSFEVEAEHEREPRGARFGKHPPPLPRD